MSEEVYHLVMVFLIFPVLCVGVFFAIYNRRLYRGLNEKMVDQVLSTIANISHSPCIFHEGHMVGLENYKRDQDRRMQGLMDELEALRTRIKHMEGNGNGTNGFA